MGLFGFGGGGGKIQRLEKRVTNKWGQPAERQRAMQVLADIGSEEALDALLKRFSFRIDGQINDEDEKRMGYEFLVAAGPRAVAPIERFVSESDGVYWPLRALKEIVGMEPAVEALLRALDRAEKITGRVNEQKVQLVSNLRDFPHPRVRDRLKVLCRDPNDEVRMMAVDGLLTYGKDEALPVIAERILDPEETPNIKAVIFEQLIENEWSLEPWRAELEEGNVFPAHYRLGAGGKIMRA
ncbi:MAG: hypothetical protein EP329_28115 [Deltaproteobacteria bacterium]|nr:MAG: hypothetical protein EP329_28115 [Deltaproteobacteria bacterium]